MVAVAAQLVAGYADAPANILATIRFAFTIAATLQAALFVRALILGAVTGRATSSEQRTALAGAMGIIRLLVSFALFAIAAVLILSNLGVNVTGLLAGLGIGGIAIGLAAQGIFADLFAALSILFDRPFTQGDGIAFDTTQGSIERVGLKSTRIRAFSGEVQVISNKNLLDKLITNNSLRTHRRGLLKLGVIYQTPAAQLRALPAMLVELVRAEGGMFVRAGFVGFGASSVDFELEFDSPGAAFDDFQALRHRLGIAILERFAAERIDFAYPTQLALAGGPDGRVVASATRAAPAEG